MKKLFYLLSINGAVVITEGEILDSVKADSVGSEDFLSIGESGGKPLSVCGSNLKKVGVNEII